MPSAQSYKHAENGEQEHKPHALLPFLQSQSQNTLTRLYQRPSSCLALFRWNFLPTNPNVMGFLIDLKQSFSACGKANCDELTLARISNTSINDEHLGEPGQQKVNLI